MKMRHKSSSSNTNVWRLSQVCHFLVFFSPFSCWVALGIHRVPAKKHGLLHHLPAVTNHSMGSIVTRSWFQFSFMFRNLPLFAVFSANSQVAQHFAQGSWISSTVFFPFSSHCFDGQRLSLLDESSDHLHGPFVLPRPVAFEGFLHLS